MRVGGRNAAGGGDGLHSEGKLPDNVRSVKAKSVQNTDRPWEAQGFLLKRLRRERGLDQATIAESLGVRRATVSDWERGVQCPRQSYLEKLAELLEVSINSLRTAGMVGGKVVAGSSGIPVLGKVSAGDAKAHTLALIREPAQQLMNIPEGAMALEVQGNSMTPVAIDGQWVICDTVDPCVGDLVVCEMPRNSAMFRRLAYVSDDVLVLEAVNPAHGPAATVTRKEVVALYRVVGVCFIAD